MTVTSDHAFDILQKCGFSQDDITKFLSECFGKVHRMATDVLLLRAFSYWKCCEDPGASLMASAVAQYNEDRYKEVISES